MDIIGVQFSPWDRVYSFSFDPREMKFERGDYAVVKTNIGIEVGKVVEVGRKEEPAGDPSRDKAAGEGKKSSEDGESRIKPVMRKADSTDVRKMKKRQERRIEAMHICRDFVKKHNLPMKLVDARFSFDGGRIIFAFIAKERVDFRKLVEDLTRYFQKSIRMQQIGVRGEAKICGDIGLCGRGLCCANFLSELGNVTLDLVHDQQVAHRGIERLSGICGRLMCCLAYEGEHYKSLAQNMPPIGTQIKTKKGKGKIIGWHVLKQTVRVRLEDGVIDEIPVSKPKK